MKNLPFFAPKFDCENTFSRFENIKISRSKTLFLIAAILFSTSFLAQNLVLNPSFELLKNQISPCAFDGKGERLTQCIKNWNGFFGQTPDPHFNDGSILNCPIPKPRTGKMAVGLICFHPRIDDFYHEHLQGTLAKPLEKGKTYRFEFWITQADSAATFHLKKQIGPSHFPSPVASNRLGVLFSVEPNSPKENFQASITTFDLRPQVVFEEILTTKRDEWRKISVDFTADRAYRFFTIGNFSSDAITQTQPAASGEFLSLRTFSEGQKVDRPISYYLFDDFLMAEKKANEAAPDMVEVLKKGEIFTFRDLLFEFGKWDLLAPSLPELERLADILMKNDAVRLEIAGHTDDVGDEKANLELSENRARAVVAFLVKKGVTENRLAARGFGESQPVVPNDSEKNRAQNRRVECRRLP